MGSRRVWLSPLEPQREVGLRLATPLKPKKGNRMPSYESSMRNLVRARKRWRRPRPWRSNRESLMVRRFAFQWFTCRDSARPSGRAWARALDVSHTWLQKLVRRFIADSNEIRRLEAAGDPKAAELTRVQEETRQMRERGELRRKIKGQRYLSQNGLSQNGLASPDRKP